MSNLWHIETVVFDVDGTLTDSNSAHAGTWAQAFREQGVAVDEQAVRRLIGMGGDKLIPAVAHVDEESPTGKAIGARKKQCSMRCCPPWGRHQAHANCSSICALAASMSSSRRRRTIAR